jgi:hypothetical protein
LACDGFNRLDARGQVGDGLFQVIELGHFLGVSSRFSELAKMTLRLLTFVLRKLTSSQYCMGNPLSG